MSIYFQVTTMDKRIDLGGGLELLVVNRVDFSNPSVLNVVKQGEELQRRVLREQKVSYPDQRVLLAADSIGTPDEPGSLDGSSGYHHIYLIYKGYKEDPIGMRA